MTFRVLKILAKKVQDFRGGAGTLSYATMEVKQCNSAALSRLWLQNINCNLPSVETLRHKPSSTNQRAFYNIHVCSPNKTQQVAQL